MSEHRDQEASREEEEGNAEAREEKAGEEIGLNRILASIPDTMAGLIRNPSGFFARMPSSGGLLEPLVFSVAMGAFAALVQAFLSLTGLSSGRGPIGALIGVILVPLTVGVLSFVSAAVCFILWKLLGARRNFETAYRCTAYASAIAPIVAAAQVLPYLGTAVGVAWGFFLMVQASVHAHGLALKPAQAAFGIVFALLAVGSLRSEYRSRRLASHWKHMQQHMFEGKDLDEMSPEEAGEALGKFFKGLKEGTGE